MYNIPLLSELNNILINNYKVISTFSGCGGSSLGYKYAGFNVITAIDFNENAINTYKLNFPNLNVLFEDINKIESQYLLNINNLKLGELDILDGSPPCQGFSIAGKRNINDIRNQLYKQFCRLINELQPKCFIMENVSGMIKSKMQLIFVEILKELKSLGYKVKVKLLNSVNYGIPQIRQRLIFIGIRSDINIEYQYPKPFKNIITIKESIKDLKDIGLIQKLSLSRLNVYKNTKIGSKFINCGFNTIKVDFNKLSNTITKHVNLVHPYESRYLSINEIKRIQSFPNDFQFIGSFNQQWARIGNSVPPLLMKVIAESLKDQILDIYYNKK
jgi:DNA (cytosine-5)-methyltransferase 1